jgi:hypothetical protein
VQDPQVYETFLQEMANHAATSVTKKFADYSAQYYDTGKVPLSFTELVDKAHRLVEISKLTAMPVPCHKPAKAVSPANTPSLEPSDNANISSNH